MGRRKLTEEEILKKQEEKEQKLKNQELEVSDFREELKTVISNLDAKILLDLLKTSETYKGLALDEVIELLFKKFSNGDFKFKSVVKYE